MRWFGSAKGRGAGFSFMSAGNLLIALITYLRFAEIARIFGTSWQTDAVSLAMVFPLLLQQLVSTGFGSAFMPIYSRVVHEKGFAAANRLVSRIINWMSISGGVLVGAVLATGSLAVRIVGPGVDMPTVVLATELLYIFLPLVLLNAVEGVLQNFLIYGKRYVLVSFLRVLQILVSYLILVFLHGDMGIMIIPVSGLIGACVSFSAAVAMSFICRLRLHAAFDPRDRDFAELIRLALPITVGTITGFLGPVADKALASFLRESSVTAIDYATRIKNLIRIVLIQPVIVLSTVSFSRIAAEGNMDRLKGEISGFIKHISYYTVPISGILVIMSASLISILFQRGNFGPDESRMVGYALAFYSAWFAQFGIGLIVRRAFYALKESFVPAALGVWAMIANVLLNIILLEPLGIGGLALATSVTSAAKTLLQMYFLRKKLNGINGSDFIPEFLKILLGTGVLVGYLLLAGMLFPVDLSASLSSRVLNTALAIVPGIVLYVTVTALAGSDTYRSFVRVIRGRLGKGSD